MDRNLFLYALKELESFWGIDEVVLEESRSADNVTREEKMSKEKVEGVVSVKEKRRDGNFLHPTEDSGEPEKDRDKKFLLEELRKEVENCRLCPLWKSRNNVVFGEGSPFAELMFIGEAPGYEEDKQGRPFVGRAGMLLTKLIEKMGLSREVVYIGNVLKCRPPNNRNPIASEIVACKRYILSQIDIIQPKVICTLGKFSTSLLIPTKSSISSMRGKVYNFKGIKVIPTFHPAYLLRNPKDKVLVWQDAQLILKLLSQK